MKGPFEAVKITDQVYWVGAVDWAVRNFHGYLTSRGTSYNAYLVVAEKITLIDTVKSPFKNELLSRIASIVDPTRISYIVSNHAEMDHSGCLLDVIRAVKPDKVFASCRGVQALDEHFHFEQELVPVKDGENLSLGNLDLTFVETPMLHWPDSMFTYLADKALLFSQDGFGMHLASSERFDDELDGSLLEQEAEKYYANILMPLSSLVTKLLDKVGKLGIKIDIIAPDHGPIWRKDLNKILKLYARWAGQTPTTKAVVVYDTMWGSTAAMARAVGEGLTEGGAHPVLIPLGSCHRSDVAAELLDAGALLVGSPTINNHMFPTVADVLTYVEGLKPRNLVGVAFGSYGWSGEAVGHLEEILGKMKVELVSESLRAKYVPTEENLAECRATGLRVAEELGKRCSEQDVAEGAA